MTINQIIDQVKADVLRGQFAVIRTPINGDPYNRYIYGVLHPNSRGENIFLALQKGYALQYYPEPNDFELVGLELHHPHNNVYKKYDIL